MAKISDKKKRAFVKARTGGTRKNKFLATCFVCNEVLPVESQFIVDLIELPDSRYPGLLQLIFCQYHYLAYVDEYNGKAI